MQVKFVIGSFLIGAVSGVFLAYSLLNFVVQYDTSGIKVKQVSGEKIRHEEFDFSKENIHFTTIAEGAGVAETEIPKAYIPEAYNWMNRVNTLSLSAGLRYADYQEAYYGLSYSRRFDRFSAGIGFDFTTNGILGIKASAGWSW